MFRNEIHKPVCKLRIWLASFTSVTNQGLFYKLACEFQYELANFATNLLTSQRSSEHLWWTFREIDCNNNLSLLNSFVVCKLDTKTELTHWVAALFPWQVKSSGIRQSKIIKLKAHPGALPLT